MTGTPDRPAFAHASEAELARILDFYAVRWRYEPDTFPIRWNLEGDVVESFSPDFYLPDLDLYVELTTLKQKLVRKKNRKLRRLRELYPDIRIKLFYARDFRMLLLKFGRLALVDELTGTTGQATPARLPLPEEAGEIAEAEVAPVPMAAVTREPAPAGPTTGAAATRVPAGRLAADTPGPLAVVPALVAEPPRPPAEARGRRRGRRRRRSADPSIVAADGSPTPAGSAADPGPR